MTVWQVFYNGRTMTVWQVPPSTDTLYHLPVNNILTEILELKTC